MSPRGPKASILPLSKICGRRKILEETLGGAGTRKFGPKMPARAEDWDAIHSMISSINSKLEKAEKRKKRGYIRLVEKKGDLEGADSAPWGNTLWWFHGP